MSLPEVPAHQGFVFVKMEQGPRTSGRGSRATWQMAASVPMAGRKHSEPTKLGLQAPSPSLWALGWVCHSDSSLLLSASPEGLGSLPNGLGGCYSLHPPQDAPFSSLPHPSSHPLGLGQTRSADDGKAQAFSLPREALVSKM